MNSSSAMGTRVSRGTALWLVALAFAATMIGGALPTPLYPEYQQRFGFGSLTVTVIFAMYAVGVLAALLLVGRASDSIGRRPVLLGGLAASAASSVVFLIAGGLHAGGVALLYLARVLSGVSAGVFAGTATAALADLAGPQRRRRASVVAATANIGGLGFGPLLSGLLARYVAGPLHTTYVVHLTLVLAGTVAVLASPESVIQDGPRRWQFQRLSLPPGRRAVFVEVGAVSFAGFALLGMFTSVSPAVLALLGHHSPALTGLVVFVVFATSTIAQMASSRLSRNLVFLAGTVGLIVGLGLVGASLAASSLGLLVAGGVLGGAAQGVSFRAALEYVTEMSPAAERSGVASSFFALSYVGLSLPIVGVGAGSRAYGLVHTGEVFTVLLGLLTAIALTSVAMRLRRPLRTSGDTSPAA